LDDALISTKQALTMALTEGSGRALRPDHVLHGVSLKVAQGNIVTIIGANDTVGLRAIMLAISRALMSKPRCLMLDKPSLGIAPILVKTIFQKIVEINKSLGTTILLVEQNANLALEVSTTATCSRPDGSFCTINRARFASMSA
jgi:ABC-type branched-subunit amino acid transport system ATPase component